MTEKRAGLIYGHAVAKSEAAGRSAGSAMRSFLRTSEAVAKRVAKRLGVTRSQAQAPQQDDTDEFIARIYRELLDREPDAEGQAYYLRRMRTGATRVDVVLEMADSAEFIDLVRAGRRLRTPGRPDLPDLTTIRPGHYALMPTPTNRRVLAFEVKDPTDFDWLEEQLRRHRYYDMPGVWSLERDDDKRLMADMLASLGPRRSLELGCSVGAVIHGLVEHGVDAMGIDISPLSHTLAHPDVTARIVLGDIIDADVGDSYDLVYGLDIFEHLNPNHLDRYLARVRDVLEPDGLVVANMPAFGDDEVFGEVATYHLKAWQQPDTVEPFRHLHVDDRGWPLHGHLIWATARWWADTFQAAGFRRRSDLERQLHLRFDEQIDAIAPARKALFVFQRT